MNFARPHKSLANAVPQDPGDGGRARGSRLDMRGSRGLARLAVTLNTHSRLLQVPPCRCGNVVETTSTAPAVLSAGPEVPERGPLIFCPTPSDTLGVVRAIYYVDGLNLYKRCLEGTALKWLDLKRLFEATLPLSTPVVRIRYFTALVEDHEGSGARTRQRTYLAALRSIPGLSIHYGTMRTDRKFMATVAGDSAGPEVEVWHTREKGTDVALGAWLFRDLFRIPESFDAAVLVTHDSDQSTTVRHAREISDKQIGVLDPEPERAKHLHQCASFYRNIKLSAVRRAQFPEVVPLRTGRSVTRPAEWA